MNTRTASAFVAAVLLAAAPVTSAFAQDVYAQPARRPAAVLVGTPYAADDVLTTGSIATRGVDSSAKYGNAGQPEREVPQFGMTSGGPAF